jgi:hypothetical protein
MSIAAETSIDAFLAGYPGYGVFALTAQTLRQHGQGIARVPILADPANGISEDPAHVEVFGTKSRGTKRAWSKAGQWVVLPRGTGG